MKNTIRSTLPRIADILISHADIKNFNRVLEPSAGHGRIADKIVSYCNEYNLEIELKCIELNKGRGQFLESKGYNVDRKDFLNYSTDNFYDRIIACPTSLRGVDVEHIKHMYLLLNQSGRLVSTFSPYRLSSDDDPGIEFRRWISDKNYYIFMLPPNSYRESGRDRPTSVIVMEGE